MSAANYQQSRILQQITTYFEIKSHKPQRPGVTQDSALPQVSSDGICSGIVAYYMYCKRLGEEDVFWYKIGRLLEWNPDNLANSTARDDPFLEELISILIFLDYDDALRPHDVHQDAIDQSIAIIFGPNATKIRPEYRLTTVFSRPALGQFVGEHVHKNKILRLSNGFHAIGLMQDDDGYTLIDPEAPELVKKFTNLAELTQEIFTDLSKFCGSTDYLAMHMSIFDLQGEPSAEYPDPIHYTQHLISTPEYKRGFIQHPNILNLALRYATYPLLDLLYTHRYQYIPWNYNGTTELNAIVLEENEEKFNFWLDHHLPLDYKAPVPYAVNAIGTAIIHNKTKMLYALLYSGADPNLEPSNGWSTIGLALEYDNKSAIILLLAFGMEIKPDIIRRIKQKYNTTIVSALIENTLAINANILGLPAHFDPANASMEQTIAYSQHVKLMRALDADIPDSILQHLEATLEKTVNDIMSIIAHKKTCTQQEAYTLNVILESLREFSTSVQNPTLKQKITSATQQITALLTALHPAPTPELRRHNMLMFADRRAAPQGVPYRVVARLLMS